MGRRSREVQSRQLSRQRTNDVEARRVAQALTRGCLFCKRDDGGFVSREHVFPESVGNVKMVLPAGVVCDRCNNGELARVDSVFCDFHPVMMRRMMLGIPNKDGQIPVLRLENGTMSYVPGVGGADPTLIIKSTGRRRILSEPVPLEGGAVELSMTARGGRPLTQRHAADLSRSLLKMTVESAWIDHGELIYEPRFDHLRSAVLGQRLDGFFAMYKKADWNRSEAGITYNFLPENEGLTHLWAGVMYAGVHLLTSSTQRAEEQIPRDLWSVVKFSA